MPARSPDFTLLDFFCGGRYLKVSVYLQPLRDVEHLKERIRVECGKLNAEIVSSITLRKLPHRAEGYLETEGGPFEHFI